eukprot:g8213.t1
MDWRDLTLQFSCSRLYTALQQFTEGTFVKIRHRSLALLNDLRASRATLQCLGRIEGIDCVCQNETTRHSTFITPLHEDAARRVTEQLRRRVQNYRTAIAEEYRILVPTTREAFEKAFDSFVDLCLHDSSSNRTDHWFEELVSTGAVEADLRFVYNHFQRQLREACSELSKCPLPPPLFRLETLQSNYYSTEHRRHQTEWTQQVSKSSDNSTKIQSMRNNGLNSRQSSGMLMENNSDGESPLNQISPSLSSTGVKQAANKRLESITSFSAPGSERTAICDVQMPFVGPSTLNDSSILKQSQNSSRTVGGVNRVENISGRRSTLLCKDIKHKS